MVKHQRQWRDYESEAGNRPVKKFLRGVKDENSDDAAAILVRMREVADEGLSAARHLAGDIWEVRVDGRDVIYRILFAPQGRFNHVLLSLDGFKKKTQKTPPQKIKLAQDRLRDWQRRGKSKPKASARSAKSAKGAVARARGRGSTRRG